ncbi:hypothetical protein GCK72_022348 [Caenorhabditis remanei]|uniref:ELM2 domain-containing protein n=1 Tax=Caenorhabditis remanei TaxID=31234 RepID=A0A6A5FU40_CAERE|nr:hypothetical protein GCK72_022348 [Caenorhabditis remanei]KAF1745901.1 hypothetical protein GCK72_022348 [Caenorhabditis remanei]
MSRRRQSKKNSSSRGRPAIPLPQDQADPQDQKSDSRGPQSSEPIRAETEGTPSNSVASSKGYLYRFINGVYNFAFGKKADEQGSTSLEKHVSLRQVSAPSSANNVDSMEDAPGPSGFVGFNHDMKMENTPVRPSLMEIQVNVNQKNGRVTRTPRSQNALPPRKGTKRARQSPCPGSSPDENSTPAQVKRSRREMRPMDNDGDEVEPMQVEEKGLEIRRKLRIRNAQGRCLKQEEIIQQKKIEMMRCQVGDTYQAVIQPLLRTNPTLEYDDDVEREELIWEPQESGALIELKKEAEEKNNHKMIRNVYFRAIWRQFGGHILFEEALLHLMKNGYDLAVSLETVDQLLKEKALIIKHARVAQVGNLAKYGVNEMISLKQLQKKALPNFTLSEVTAYHFQYMKHYMFMDQWDGLCQCWDDLCQLEKFESRVGCANCTKHRRTRIKGQGLCLICKTHKRLTKRMRPAANVFFTLQEEEQLEKWERKERIAGKALNRVEFERLMEKDNEERLRKLEITDEEQEIMKSMDRRTKKLYEGMTVREKGDWLVKQLAPFKLPQMWACYCNWTRIKAQIIKEQDLELVEHPEPLFVFKFFENFNPWVAGWKPNKKTNQKGGKSENVEK